ncbi:FecCD family ABC transporter permease [Plantibacter cousiniae (nom. nud.)]|uniref:FecCD family ABC transporter permease n=1 Tax=Plantibacter cousiniae (nom. nud.) TaxID=199709 RepID=UPI001D84EA9E|nr:iron ABC transporter permease [Plantibacter cousiniae]CAH0242570.1 Hemin transport system permease protein HmuU [Plantibacter cousiniae]
MHDRQAPFASAPRTGLLLVVLTVILVILGVMALAIGSVGIAFPEVFGVVAAHLGGPPPASAAVNQIVWEVRAPRTVLAMVAGGGLATAGAVIQAVVRNPLGDPSLIGVTPGASLGAVVVIVLGGGVLGGLPLTLAAFLGALATFAVVFLLGRSAGRMPPTRLILAGVAIGYLVSSMTYFLQTIATPNQVQRVLFWSLGSVGGADWGVLPIPVIVVLLGTAWILVNAVALNAIVGGDDLAASLGIDVPRLQVTLLVLVAGMTGSLVAVAGGIAFVGLVVPHIARLLVGADHRRMLPATALLGAIFLLLADLVARTVRAPAELPIGVITAAVGAPFFLWLLTSGRTARAGRAPAGGTPALRTAER